MSDAWDDDHYWPWTAGESRDLTPEERRELEDLAAKLGRAAGQTFDEIVLEALRERP